MFEPDYSPAGWEQQQAEEEMLRYDLDQCLVVYKHDLQGTAMNIARRLGIEKQFRQEIGA